MGNLIQWLQPDAEFGWTNTRIFRATSESGTYSQIQEQIISDTSYHDVSGTDDHWYKLAFWDSVNSIQSSLSDPIQAEHFLGYATIQEVRDYTRVTSKEFDDNTIQLMINRATSRINEETARTWLGVQTFRGYRDGDDTDLLWLYHTDIQDILHIAIDTSYSGTYTEVFTKNFLDGVLPIGQATLTLVDATDFPDSGTIQIDDELITYTGKSGNDLTGLTRGTSGTIDSAHANEVGVFLNANTEMAKRYEEGYLVLTKASPVSRFVANPQSVKLTYLTGNNNIPGNIKNLCLLMVSQMMHIEGVRVTDIDKILKKNSWKGPVGIS